MLNIHPFSFTPGSWQIENKPARLSTVPGYRFNPVL